MAEPAPAFYARAGGAAADWWTLLHPPYTLWAVSNAAIGAALAPELDPIPLLGCLGAFFLGVGIAAHALDEFKDRPLRTSISDRVLVVATVVALTGATALGVIGAWYVATWPLLVVVPVGVALVLAYNLELFGGVVHTDWGFALSWGGFPVAVSLAAQAPPFTPRVLVVGVLGTTLGVLLASAQRRLSTPARALRRRIVRIEGVAESAGGSENLTRDTLLTPLEGALRALCWAVPTLAVALLATHL